MRPLSCLVALVVTTCAVSAQATCSAGPGPATSIATQSPFMHTHFYGHPNFPNPPGVSYTGFNFMFDLTTPVDIDIAQIDLRLYDDGGGVSGQPLPMPNQVGATANAELYIFPLTSWIGLETMPAVWPLLGTGTLTVQPWPVHSAIVFNPPLTLPFGMFGMALKVDMPTNGPNPGPLHPMVNVPPPNSPVPTYSDGLISIVNLQFQRESWTATLASASNLENLEIHYTPQSGYANWTSYGAGCVAPNAPIMGLSARPVIGTTIDFETTNIQAGTVLNFWLFGFTPDAAGFGLGQFGLPGCNLHLQFGSGIVTNVSGVSNGLSTVPLPIPNDPAYSGIVLYGQSAPATPGSNAGFFLSNATCVAIGIF